MCVVPQAQAETLLCDCSVFYPHDDAGCGRPPWLCGTVLHLAQYLTRLIHAIRRAATANTDHIR